MNENTNPMNWTAICDHCGGDFREELLYMTANGELVCILEQQDCCFDWLPEEHITGR